MADHSKPTISSNYLDFVTELDTRFDDLALGLDPANTNPTNLPNKAIRWSSSSKKWEQLNGTTWGDLSGVYNININGSVGSVTPSTGSFTSITSSTSASLPANTTIDGVAAVNLTSTQTITNKTISTGSSWLGNIIGSQYGGTNSSAIPTSGAVAVGTGTAYGFTTVGTSGQVLISAGTSIPTWSSSLSLTSISLTGNISVNGGTISSSAATATLLDTPTTITVGSAAISLTIGAPSGIITLRNPSIDTSVTTGTLSLFNSVSTGTINIGSNTSGGNTAVRFTTASSSATTGALIVGGGIGISGVSYFGNDVYLSGTGALKFPVGDTSQRPTGAVGKVRFNSTLNRYEGHNGTSWSTLGGGATGGGSDQVFYENGKTVTADYTISGSVNAGSFGPISVASGVVVTVSTGAVWTVV